MSSLVIKKKAKALNSLFPQVKGQERFKLGREALGLTNQQIADAAGYRRRWAAWEMSQIATGKRVPIGKLKRSLTEMGLWR